MIRKIGVVLGLALCYIAPSAGSAYADTVIGPVNQPGADLPAGCAGAGIIVCTNGATPGPGLYYIGREGTGYQSSPGFPLVPGTTTPPVGGTDAQSVSVLPPITTPPVDYPTTVCLLVTPCAPAGSPLIGSQTVTPPPVEIPATPVLVPAMPVGPVNVPPYEAAPVNYTNVTIWSIVEHPNVVRDELWALGRQFCTMDPSRYEHAGMNGPWEQRNCIVTNRWPEPTDGDPNGYVTYTVAATFYELANNYNWYFLYGFAL